MPDSSDHMASQPSISLESGISAVIRQRPAPITSIVCDSLNGVSDRFRLKPEPRLCNTEKI